MKSNGRRSPREIIESVSQPELEEAWIKEPLKDMRSLSISREENSATYTFPIFRRHIKRKLTRIHTHPSKHKRYRDASNKDYETFLLENIKSDVIAQTDPETGELIGYSLYRKMKSFSLGKIPSRSVLVNVSLDLWYQPIVSRVLSTMGINSDRYSEKIFSKYGLQYRYVPNKHYSGGNEA